jgi:glycosyltransferase involved in cell wall biosynthesis
VKTILTVHEPQPFNLAPSSRYQLLGWKRLLAAFDHLIVHSEQGLAELQRLGLREDHCDVIPIGVLRFPETHCHYRGTLDPSKVIILLFGALKPYKGLDLFLAAIRHLDEGLKRKLHVIIAGEPYMALAEHQAYCKTHQLDRLISWDLRFVDARELDHLFRHVDVMCFPYRSGDTSGVLMAAIHYGKAVVAAEVGAFASYLRHEETALLFPAGDADQLTGQLARVVSDATLRRRLGHNLQTLPSVESWATIAAKTAAVYERLIGR